MLHRVYKLIALTIALLFFSANTFMIKPAYAGPLFYSRESAPYNVTCSKHNWFFNDVWSHNLPTEGYTGLSENYVNGIQTATLAWSAGTGVHTGVLTYNEEHPLVDDHGYPLGFPVALPYTAKSIYTYYSLADHHVIARTTIGVVCDVQGPTVSIFNE